jgi:hypothetical protein
MVICSHCNHENSDGAKTCAYCSKPLQDPMSATYLVLSSEKRKLRNQSTKPFRDTAPLVGPSPVSLHIDGGQPIALPAADRILLGRIDPEDCEEEGLVVDLTSYNGLKKGVSRIHAIIERKDDQFILIDQASVNGTYLNNDRIAPYDPHVLANGNQIRLGTLVMLCFLNTDA